MKTLIKIFYQVGGANAWVFGGKGSCAAAVTSSMQRGKILFL